MSEDGRGGRRIRTLSGNVQMMSDLIDEE